MLKLPFVIANSIYELASNFGKVKYKFTKLYPVRIKAKCAIYAHFFLFVNILKLSELLILQATLRLYSVIVLMATNTSEIA